MSCNWYWVNFFPGNIKHRAGRESPALNRHEFELQIDSVTDKCREEQRQNESVMKVKKVTFSQSWSFHENRAFRFCHI